MNIDFKSLRKIVEEIKVAGEVEKVYTHDTMYNRFCETEKEMPNALCINMFGNKVTYKEMLKLIDEMADGFYELGIRKDDVVNVSILSTLHGIASVYALDKIGAFMHLVNCTSGIDEVKRECSNLNSKYFIGNDILLKEEMIDELSKLGVEKFVTTSLLDGMPEGFNFDKTMYKLIEKLKGLKKKNYDNDKVLNFDTLIKLGKNSNYDLKPCSYEKNHKAAIAYTSGSTGDSKACVGTWEGIDSMVLNMAMTEQGRFERGDNMFTTFPTWIYYSLLNMIHEPLLLGVSLSIDPLFNPANLSRRNKQYHFNHWLTIPQYLKMAIESDKNKNIDCSRWKIVLTGGDNLPDDLKKKADEFILKHNGNVSVVQGYGASECLGSFSYCYYKDSSLGSVGKPCIGNMIKILDVDTKEEVKQGEVGVGYFYSPALMSEYYGDKIATDKALIKDENGTVWYNTEDLLHQNSRGEIFLDGRLRRIALTLDKDGNPAKIIPEKTKKAISKLDSVLNCEVITVEDEKIANKAVAFIVLKDESNNNETYKENIKDYCLSEVNEYMVPKDVVILDEMPLTASKKNDIKKLEEMYKEMKENKNSNNKQKIKR